MSSLQGASIEAYVMGFKAEASKETYLKRNPVF